MAKPPPFFDSLKSRIALITAVLMFVAVGTVTAASLLLARHRMEAIVGNQQYTTLISAAAYIDGEINAKKNLLRATAESLPDDVIGDTRLVQRFLEGRLTLREEFSNVAVFDVNGAVIASLNSHSGRERVNVSSRDYFKDTVRDKDGVVSSPMKSQLSGKSVILITQPVNDGAGHLRFIIGGALDLTSPRIFGQLETLRPGATGYLFLISGDGTIILHPDKSRILRRAAEEAGGATLGTSAALKGFEGTIGGVSKNGVPSLLTYRRLHTNDWILGSVYPTAEAFAPFEEASNQALATAFGVSLLAGTIGWLGISRVLRPLAVLQRHVANASKAGGSAEAFNVTRSDEFGRLSRAFYALSKTRETAEAALAGQAMTDALTGLNNRRMFDNAIELAFARALRSKAILIVAYLDIDRFKLINDEYGHGGGDEILVEFGRRLRTAVRCTDTVVRIAGDEFVVIFESYDERVEPEVLGQKILDVMEAPFRIGDTAINVTTSIGICAGPTVNVTVAAFIKFADLALYQSKKAGRGRFSIHLVDGSLP